ncbi:MAG: hypothetical protein GX642_04630 [Smithella sp.]|nr:hypothetical protein [Smithella sp.]
MKKILVAAIVVCLFAGCGSARQASTRQAFVIPAGKTQNDLKEAIEDCKNVAPYANMNGKLVGAAPLPLQIPLFFAGVAIENNDRQKFFDCMADEGFVLEPVEDGKETVSKN